MDAVTVVEAAAAAGVPADEDAVGAEFVPVGTVGGRVLGPEHGADGSDGVGQLPPPRTPASAHTSADTDEGPGTDCSGTGPLVGPLARGTRG